MPPPLSPCPHLCVMHSVMHRRRRHCCICEEYVSLAHEPLEKMFWHLKFCPQRNRNLCYCFGCQTWMSYSIKLLVYKEVEYYASGILRSLQTGLNIYVLQVTSAEKWIFEFPTTRSRIVLNSEVRLSLTTHPSRSGSPLHGQTNMLSHQ